jgi:hypothetical protein
VRYLGASIICLALCAAIGAGRGVPRAPFEADSTTMTGSPLRHATPVATRRVATWCGTTATADRAPVATGYSIRVLYGVPADGADNSAAVASSISDWIDQVEAWWQREDPSRLPRFDMYAAPCGPQVDLQVVRLSSVSVGNTDGHQVFQNVWTQLQSEADAGSTKFLMFLDDVNTGNLCGVGGPASDAQLGSPAMGLSIVFLASCDGADRPTVAAHELLHALNPGTLLQGAPHLCPGDVWHVCDSSGDVLYPYVEAGIPLTSLQLDVNHDDYWAGNAPVNLQVQPWLKHTQDQVHLGLAITGSGKVTSDVPGLDCTASCGSDWDRGDVVDLSPESADGYRFIRWTGAGCSGVADCSLTLDAAKSVSALFAPDTYQLRVSVTGKGTVASTPLGIKCTTRTCAKAFTSYYTVFLVAKPAKGWKLKSWTGACHGSKLKCRLGMTAPSAARATFVKTR